MNQILMIGNKNKNNNTATDIKKIVMFFSIAIIVFGSILIINGVVGLNSNKNKYGMIPSTPSPLPTSDTSMYDDDENPEIELILEGENVKILATDNLELDYIEYYWNDEEAQRVYPEEDNKKEIQKSINIKQGVNTLNVIAVDKAGNNQDKAQRFQGKIRPEVKIEKTPEGDAAVITAVCEDGLSKIDFTLNEERNTIPLEGLYYTDEVWATINAIVEYSSDGKIIRVQYTHPFVEGENELDVYAYSLEGLVGGNSGRNTYTPAQ